MVDSVEVGRGHIEIDVRTDSLERGLENARQSFSSWANNIATGILQGLGQQLFSSIVSGLQSAVGVMQQSVQDASNLTESINKLGVAFGDSADEMLEWSRTSATALGQSQQQALEAASSFGLMFRSMGVGGDQAVEMSKSLVQLASDLASINNIGVDEALQKLRAGLIGEAEPLRAVGVLLSETAVRQKAVQMGLAETTEAVSDQEKVMARYQLILDQTALAQGDFARTSGELANSQRTLAAQVADLSADLGQALLPIQLAFTRGLSELITIVAPYGMQIMDSFAGGLADGIIAILPVLAQLRQLFVYWLEPGSPPRLLPDLDKWGKEAMQVYLDSWSSADFDSLKALGGTIEQILRSFVASGKLGETDLVKRIFGGRKAIEEAVNQFSKLGKVSAETFAAIAREAGPAGKAIDELVKNYFDLQSAAAKTARAQRDLNDVTRQYDDALRPVNEALDANLAKQDELRDQQRAAELGKVISDPTKTADERQLARLELQQIELENQADAIGKERDAAVGAAEDKVSAAKKEEDAAKAKFDASQAAIDQQVKVNDLIGQEIELRNRLANEAMAKQQQAQRELEAEQRKAEAADKARLGELERIHNAQLAFQMATTDSAGQLKLLQAELANTEQGSADYYNILTRIAQLQEKMKKEAEGEGGGLLGPITDAGKPGGDLQKASEGVGKLSEALEKAFDTLSGKNQPEVKLNPAFQGFVDTVKLIEDEAWNAIPIIQEFIDTLLGAPGAGGEVDETTDPFGDNWWLKGIVPAIGTLINDLDLIRQGKWGELWVKFKQDITDFRDSIDPESDPSTFGFYSFLVDTLIPAVDALRVGDWARVWRELGGAMVEQFVVGITSSANGQIMQKLALDLVAHDGLSFIKHIGELFGGGGGGGATPEAPQLDPGAGIDWDKFWKDFWGGALKALPMPIMPLPNTPQSFTPPSADGSATLAFASGPATSNTFYINQEIGTGGDFGGARQGAQDGIRQALIAGRLA